MSSKISALTTTTYDYTQDFFVLERNSTANFKCFFNNFFPDNTNSYYGFSTTVPAQRIDVNQGIIQSRRTVSAGSANDLPFFSMGYNKDVVNLDVISNYVFNVESIDVTTDAKFHLKSFEATGAYGNVRDLSGGTFYDVLTVQKQTVGIGTTSPSLSYLLDVGGTGLRTASATVTGALSANSVASTTTVTGDTGSFTTSVSGATVSGTTGSFTGTVSGNALASTTSVNGATGSFTGNLDASRLSLNTASTSYRLNINGGIGLGLGETSLPQIQYQNNGWNILHFLGCTNGGDIFTVGVNGRKIFSGGPVSDITLSDTSYGACVQTISPTSWSLQMASAGSNPRTPINCIFATATGAVAFGQFTVTSGYQVEVNGKIKADNLPDDLVNAGSYTPTITNISNVNAGASITLGHRWVRVDEVIFLTGALIFTPSTTATTFSLRITLPVASNFTDSLNVTGSVTGYQSNVVLPATNPAICTATADTTNDQIILNVLGIGSVGTGDSVSMNYSISYLVV